MSTRISWYTAKLTKLARRPVEIPDGYVEVIYSVLKGKVTVLCPVNMVNKLPKSLALPVQCVFLPLNNFDGKLGIIGRHGEMWTYPHPKDQRLNMLAHRAAMEYRGQICTSTTTPIMAPPPAPQHSATRSRS